MFELIIQLRAFVNRSLLHSFSDWRKKKNTVKMVKLLAWALTIVCALMMMMMGSIDVQCFPCNGIQWAANESTSYNHFYQIRISHFSSKLSLRIHFIAIIGMYAALIVFYLISFRPHEKFPICTEIRFQYQAFDLFFYFCLFILNLNAIKKTKPINWTTKIVHD